MRKNLLNSITDPHQIHHLSLQELIQLSQECRQRIIDVTSKAGGHLASSLGSIEITIALFKLFDFRTDRIVWDVGHQAYAHKILTGRNAQFESLTQKTGLKNFFPVPKVLMIILVPVMPRLRFLHLWEWR